VGFQEKLLNQQMSPENQWLEDIFPIEIVPLEKTHRSFQGCICHIDFVCQCETLRFPCITITFPIFFPKHTHQKNASVLCSFAGMNQFIASSGGLKITGFG